MYIAGIFLFLAIRYSVTFEEFHQ